MKIAPKPSDEKQRLQSLKELDILNTPINKGFERITRLTKTLFEVPIVAISLIDDERQWFKSIQGLDVCETSREVSFCAHTILQDEVFCIHDTLLDDRFVDNPLVTGSPHIRFYAGYPIKGKNGAKIGSLCIIDIVPREFSSSELLPLKDMAALVEDELLTQKISHSQSQLIKEFDEVARNSMIDPLTRLWNRGAIENLLFKEIIFYKAMGKPFGLVMIDIDHFKMINDTYGHSAGDEVLRVFSKRLVEFLREEDALGRWGGEEILAIIEAPTTEKLFELVSRARAAIEKTFIEYQDKKIHLTFSAGLMLVEPSTEANMTELINRVDEALYKAKKLGRNIIVVV